MTQLEIHKPNIGFADLGLAPILVDVITRLGFTTPSPIQAKAIPVALTGADLMGIAQTGTGKTLAFGLPMLQQLAKNKGTGLIILPTRELAMQVEETLAAFSSSFGLRTAILVGGAPMNKQLQALRQNPHVIVATPGRLNDHLDHKTVNLTNVRFLVLDEADRMLDMGFEPQIKRILATVPKDRQTALFSATMPEKIKEMALRYMRSPLTVEIARAGSTGEQIIQEMYFVSKESKLQLLDKMLTDHPGSVLVFSRTKHGARKLADKVRGMGHTSADIHSNRSLSQRQAALSGFKSGKYRVLVATDIAARGIDVQDIGLVVNYDLPDNPEDYVHRIGRTGRAGKKGKAVSFAEHNQRRDVKDIERLMKRSIPETPVAGLPAPRQLVPGQTHSIERPERSGLQNRNNRHPRTGNVMDKSRRPNFQNRAPRRPHFGSSFGHK
ncbi:MAG: DEAD/DEAH box helicase [Candidatus Vogelbacteria bacterium]|nr:DEAD/DEAH box helicase [Candidatus Vogelbacteria bacterium]